MSQTVIGSEKTSAFHRYRRRLIAWATDNSLSLYAAAMVLLLAALAVAPAMVIAIPPGFVGVLWKRFDEGTVIDHVLTEGTHVIAPWDRVYPYDVRLRNLTKTYAAVAANGLSMSVELSVRFRLNPHAAGLVHKLAGPDYADTLVQPEIASLLYEYVSQYDPEQFYSLRRSEIQSYLLTRARQEFPMPSHEKSPDNIVEEDEPPERGPALVRIEGILVSNVTLPDSVRAAIERKAEQQQILQEYQFRLAREAKERDRKRIEAEGIHDFQAIVANTITQEYLRLRGIEATTALANSPNSKMIIIGGKDGLPVILNTGDDGHSTTPPPAAAPATGSAAVAPIPPGPDVTSPPPSGTPPAAAAAK